MTRREKFIEVFGARAFTNVIEITNEGNCASNVDSCKKCDYAAEPLNVCKHKWWNSEYKGVDNGKEETESK